MSQHEIDQLWAELRALRTKVDRLYWALLVLAAAVGGQPLLAKVLG
jgi:hypothetical protein